MQEVLSEVLVPIQLVKGKSESDSKVVKNRFYSGAIAREDERPRPRTGLGSEDSKNKWVFIDKEQGGGLRMEHYKEKTSRVKGMLVNPT